MKNFIISSKFLSVTGVPVNLLIFVCKSFFINFVKNLFVLLKIIKRLRKSNYWSFSQFWVIYLLKLGIPVQEISYLLVHWELHFSQNPVYLACLNSKAAFPNTSPASFRPKFWKVGDLKKISACDDLKSSCHVCLPGRQGLTMFLAKKRLLKIKYGFEV